MPQAPWERQEAAAPRARAPEPSGLLAPERGSKSDISASLASAFNGRNPPAETLIKPRPQSAKGVFSPPRDNLSIGALIPLGAHAMCDVSLDARSADLPEYVLNGQACLAELPDGYAFDEGFEAEIVEPTFFDAKGERING